MNIRKQFDFTIRPAAPEDGTFAADLIFSTGPDLFEFIFYRKKKKTIKLIGRLFAENDNSFSHACAHIAELDGQPAGLIHAVDSKEKRIGNRTLAGALVKQIGWLSFLVRMRRFMIVDRLIPVIEKNSYYIQHLATMEAFRRRGVGRSLLEFSEKQAARRQLCSLMLDVEAGNATAISLYRSFGFKIARKIDSSIFRRKYDFKGLYRMTKQIKY